VGGSSRKLIEFPSPGVDILGLIAPPPRESREKRSHYASELLSCPRQLFYKWIGAPETNPPTQTQLLKMEAGADAHALFLARLKDAERRGLLFLVDNERPVELNIDGLVHPIRGYIDYIIAINNERYIIEYKSTFGHQTTRILEEPRLAHLVQLWVYAHAEEADHYVVIYEDRGSKLGFWYEITEIDGELWYNKEGGKLWAPTGVHWQRIIDKLKLIEEAVAAQEPPPRVDPITGEEFRAFLSKDGKKIQKTKVVLKEDGTKEVARTHWLCGDYCSYRDLCWLGDKEAT